MSNSVAARIIDFIQPRLNRRSVAFLLCLLLSGLFWLLTSLSNEYVDEISIPVVYNNLPESMLIANVKTTTVNAEVKGSGFDLMWYWLRLENVEITVSAKPSDLPTIQKNGKVLHYILTDDKSNRMASIKDNQLEIQDISPDTLFLRIAPKFIKQLPVKLNAEITFAKQFGMVTKPVVFPDSVLIIGMKEEMDTVSYILTKPQKWIDVNESLTTEVQLQKDERIPFSTMSQSTVRVELNVVEFTEGSVTVPLTIIADKPESVKVFPQEVEIKYQVPLADYDKIEATQFQATVTLNDKNMSSSSLTVSLARQPQEVTQLRINPPVVEFIVQK